MKNNVVLIGGNGLVGKATKRLLTKKGFNVFILDKRVKSNTEDIFVDITKKNTLIKLKEFIPKNSFIVNLAAKQYGDKPPKNNRELWFDTTNYHGAISCLEFAKSNLSEKGSVYFEINENLFNEMESLLASYRFSEIELKKDVFGKYRFIRGLKSSSS